MPLDDSRRLVARERDSLLAQPGTAGLLVGLGPFLERLEEDTDVAAVLSDMRREAGSVHERFAQHDKVTVERLKALRVDVPEDLNADSETGAGSLAGNTLCKFDAIVGSASDLHETPAIGGREDLSSAAKLIRVLEIRLHRVPEAIQTILRPRLTSIASSHEHVFRDYSLRLRNTAGFALNRLLLVRRQLNPSPAGDIDPSRSFDEHYRGVVGDPDVLRRVAHGHGARPIASHEEKAADAHVRSDVGLVCDDVLRRLETRRSREGVLGTYKLRCEWYDVAAIERLVREVEDEHQKEDRLADHLALFLFDSGLRPLTRAMVGRLEPDLFEGFSAQPGFYVEVKQYGDREGGQKAVRDGPRQIWSTAERLRSRYELREAFFVVFRRGGPLLRFEGPATARELTIRPFLVDLAPSRVSGHKQGEIIDVSIEKLLAASTE